MAETPGHHLCKDGSSTIYSSTFHQFYHNPNGAVAESIHVFFEQPGLLATLKSSPEAISVFEMGFGTGLNFVLLADLYLRFNAAFPLSFFSVEAFPITPDEAGELNYGDFLDHPHLMDGIPEIFQSLKPGLNQFNPIPGKQISLTIYNGLFENIERGEFPEEVDFFFHDPFSPEVNESLWQPDTFAKLRLMANDRSVLATYSAASKARASMAKAGWKVAPASGALGKREMTLASPNSTTLSGFKRVNEDRLIERWDSGDFK